MASLPEHLMPRPLTEGKLPREVMEAHQRERVLGAATEVFVKRGYPATTVDHLVAAARVGVGRFYTLFEGKEDCFLAAYDVAVAEGRARIEAALPSEGSQRQRVCRALAEFLRLIAEEPMRARLVLLEAQTAGPAGLARNEEVLERIGLELARLREDRPLGPELPDGMEVAILGGAVWYLQQRIVLGELGEAPALLPELTEIVIEPYLGREQTERLLGELATN